MKKNILIITGEPSGDIRGGELLKELKSLLPDYDFWGIGGDRMTSEGAELIEHVRNLSIVGVTEALKSLVKIRGQYLNVIKHIETKKPALAILIDYPGFNLKIARHLKRLNIPVVYYIIPQVWAWGAWRINSLKKYVDKAIVLFEFEKELLERHGINAEFTGHPLMENFPPPPVMLLKNDFHFSILPGSRKSEVENLLPTMLDAAEILSRRLFKKDLPPDFPEDICIRSSENELCNKHLKIMIAQSSNVDGSIYSRIIEKYKDLDIHMIMDDTAKTLGNSSFTLVASGTATLEAAVMEKPMIICYRAPLLNSMPYKILVRTPFLGLVNIIAGKELCPELLQKNATAEKLAETALGLLRDPEKLNDIKTGLRQVRKSLGEKGASLRAAKVVTHFIQENNL